MLNFKILSLVILLLVSLIPQNFADSKVAVIDTKFGKIIIEFFPDDAPKTVENFIKLAESGFYDKTKFHRIIPDFMIQGGDPLSKDNQRVTEWGTGDAGYKIDAEFNNIKHKRGIVSMARSADPDSASSQFFIVQKDSTYLDGKYTVFGRLITQESYDVLDKIASLETIHDDSNQMPLDIPKYYGDAEISSIKIKNRSEIPNVLDLGEPERVVKHYTLDENGKYSNTLYGFSFQAPQGWLVQEPEKSQPETPDVIIVGSTIDGFTPVISFLIEDSNGISLEDHIKNNRKNIQSFIDEGKLQIVSEENKKIMGYNGHVTDAQGGFVSKDKILLVKYKEIVLETNDKFYTITYTNLEKNFDSYLTIFNEVLDSFKADSQESTVPNLTSEIGIGIGIAIIATITVIVLKRRKKPTKQKSKQN